jgi:hypothetical protein
MVESVDAELLTFSWPEICPAVEPGAAAIAAEGKRLEMNIIISTAEIALYKIFFIENLLMPRHLLLVLLFFAIDANAAFSASGGRWSSLRKIL